MTTINQSSLDHDPVIVGHDAVPTGDIDTISNAPTMSVVEESITHDSLPTRDDIAQSNQISVENGEPKKLECGCRAQGTALIVCFDGTSNKFGENVAFTAYIQGHKSEPLFLYLEYQCRRDL